MGPNLLVVYGLNVCQTGIKKELKKNLNPKGSLKLLWGSAQSALERPCACDCGG